MKRQFHTSFWCLFLALLFGIPSWPAYNEPALEPQRQTSEEGALTSEESDTHAIYSMLLKTEVGPEWKITAWAINRQTQTFPNATGTFNIDQCLAVSKEQEKIYSPLIADYEAKNNRKQTLERKFDLPEYTLVDVGETPGSANPSIATSILFEVSATGFNVDRSRALVYVGHRCGSLCGGGGYHLLVKTKVGWQVDRGYRGISCRWAS